MQFESGFRIGLKGKSGGWEMRDVLPLSLCIVSAMLYIVPLPLAIAVIGYGYGYYIIIMIMMMMCAV